MAVVNTCGFLKEARDEAMGEIDKLVRQKQAGNLKKIIVTGCMAQWWHDQLAERCPEADGFVGVGSYQDIAKVIDEALEGQRPALFGDINAPVPETDRVVCTSDHWAWLRIAEGCDNYCAFCIIPKLRGHYRSRKMEELIAEAKTLAEALYFLNACAKSGFSMAPEDVRVFDPVPMPLVRLMDVERAQLLVEADGRASLNRFLWQWQATFNAPSGIDWTIEVDPASI